MESFDLVGFENFDVDTVEEIKQKMKPLLNKYDRMFGKETIKELKLIVSTKSKEGEEKLHEIIATLNTTLGDYRAVKSGWEILSVVDEIESVLERQIKEKKERVLKEREGRNA